MFHDVFVIHVYVGDGIIRRLPFRFFSQNRLLDGVYESSSSKTVANGMAMLHKTVEISNITAEIFRYGSLWARSLFVFF